MVKPWGYELQLDLFLCNKEIIKDTQHIKYFLASCVNIMDMVPYGEPILEYFGTGEATGYTAIQLIETSNITIHFADISGFVTCNFYSCKKFDPQTVIDFSIKYWDAKKHIQNFTQRGFID
jgi:S-adenosylmethionine decarboxylase.